MVYAAVRSKVVALLLLIRCLLLLPLWDSVTVICFVVHYLFFTSSFAIIETVKRNHVDLLILSSWCHVMAVWLFLAVSWVLSVVFNCDIPLS